MLGRESNLNFWEDNWLPICGSVQGPLPLQEASLQVKDVFLTNGWNWEAISMALPSHILSKLKATLISMATRGEDRLVWAVSAGGNFDLKSAYKLANGKEEAEQVFEGHWIWKLNTLPRIYTFLWMCCHNSIAVRECISKRGMMEPIECQICSSNLESIIHALCDCVFVKHC